MHFNIPLAELPCKKNDFGNHHFGNTSSISKRCIKYWNSFCFSRPEIDLIRTNAEATHRQKPFRISKRFCSNLSFTSDSQNMDIPYFLSKLDGIQRRIHHLDLKPLPAKSLMGQGVNVFKKQN